MPFQQAALRPGIAGTETKNIYVFRLRQILDARGLEQADQGQYAELVLGSDADRVRVVAGRVRLVTG